MAEVTDYYELLGVPETASPEAIKRAFRTRARATHPDHHPGDPEAMERFKSLQRAYETLSDANQREAYDHTRLGWGGFGDAFESHTHGAPFGDRYDPLVSLFFGDTPPTAGVGADVEARVKLTFDQALRGGKTEVRLAGGETVRLTVPKGVRSGLKVRVKGRGKAGPDGRGDLYVTFRVDPAGRFRREGDNLHVVEAVSALEAILGTARSITNAYGQTMKVQIPPGTQPGERLRLRGQGVETATRRGDLFVEVQVTVPRQLSDTQRRALGEAARHIGLL
ncbi:DnaJ C-terminal domain-containing protein [Rubrivirga sp. IMCC43871]|uniref:DnaJ C-terminal domain-containing protein n=1 Tax=Rubrivirga sp. IMCC43871 TaxID=3391575 RepID=UPI00398FF20E